MATPTFQEQLDALLTAYVPADKQTEAKEKFTPIASAMTKVFQGYASDIDAAKERLRALEGIKPEDHKRLEDQLKTVTEELTTVQTQLTDFQTKYETANTALLKVKGELTATNKEKEVRKALGAFNIAPDSVEEVYDIILSRVMEDKDGALVIPHTVKSKDAAGTEIVTEAKSNITDYLTKHWAVTPFAKRVLLADYTTGGDASGSGKRTPGSKAWKDMSFTEKTILTRDNPALAHQLQAAEGTKE